MDDRYSSTSDPTDADGSARTVRMRTPVLGEILGAQRSRCESLINNRHRDLSRLVRNLALVANRSTPFREPFKKTSRGPAGCQGVALISSKLGQGSIE